MKLDFRLRDGENASNDKPKIFVYLSPDDHFLYDELIDLFLSSLNCAVFFCKNNTHFFEKEILKSMNLFAILVTENLLNDFSHVLDNYRLIAEQYKIPIFFFRLSDINFDDFESKYGCLHIFDATCIDGKDKSSLTERFRGRLFDFLTVSDDISEIKTAFDAQLFLSYRKKDYKFLNSFLRMIHSYPKLRDVAIWYDDFLIPGRDYNQSIEAAMYDSALFLLLVTDNLLEDKNYVARIEYPFALENNKAVFPFQFECTDQNKLKEKFNNLPPCVNVSNNLDVENALINISKHLNLDSPKKSPRHLYLIGLAYLLGICVEKNEELSLDLIMSSAEHGYSVALLKLGEMYADGQGVLRDDSKAIFFLEKYVASVSSEPICDLLHGVLEGEILSSGLSVEEYNQYLSLKTGILGVKRLLLLYKSKKNYNVDCFNNIFSFCKMALDCTSAFSFFMTKYTTIIGYEKIKGEDGKYKVGESIIKEKCNLIDVIVDPDMFDILHMMIFEFSAKVKKEVRMRTLHFFTNIYEEMIGIMKNHSFFSKCFGKKVVCELATIYRLMRNLSLENMDLSNAARFHEKNIYYEKESKSEFWNK